MRTNRWVLALLLLAASGCPKPEDGAKPDRAKPDAKSKLPLAKDADEIEAWKRFASRHRRNRYLPEAYARTPGKAAQNTALKRFRQYRAAREAVATGRASTTLRDAYFREKLEDLEQRAEILQFLEQRLARRLYPSPHEQLRLSRIRQLFGQLKTLADELRQHKRQLDAKAEKGKPPAGAERATRPRVLCLVDDYGFIRCQRESRLTDAFMAGHWQGANWITDAFDEARAFDVLHTLDRLDSAWEAPRERNTRVGCPNGTWMAVDTHGPAKGEVSVAGLPSTVEMRWMLWACRSWPRADIVSDPVDGPTEGTAAGLGGRDTGWVANTLEALDRKLEACAENERGQVIRGDGPRIPPVDALTVLTVDLASSAERVASKRRVATQLRADALHARAALLAQESELRRLEQAVETARQAAKASELQALETKKRAQDARAQAAARATDKGPGAAGAKRGPEPSERGQESAKSGQPQNAPAPEGPASGNTGDEKPARPPASPATLEKQAQQQAVGTAKAWQEVKAAQAGVESARAKRAAAAKVALAQAKRAAIHRVAPPPQLGILPGADCPTKQRHWHWFKQQCNARNGWERRGDLCHDLLRRSNRCLDTDRLGQRTQRSTRCELALFPEQQQWVEFCEKEVRQFSVAEGVAAHCDFLAEPLQAVANLPELCRDPANQPATGTDCRPPQPEKKKKGEIVPLPSPDLIRMGALQILDGLALQGLGFAEKPRPSPGDAARRKKSKK